MSLSWVNSTEWPFLSSSVRAPSLCSSQVTASCVNNFYNYLHILSFVRLQSTHTGFLMLFLGFLLVEISYFSAWPLKNQQSVLYLFSLQVYISWGSFNQIPKQIKFCWLEIQACDPAVSFFDFLSWSWTPPSYSQSLFERISLKNNEWEALSFLLHTSAGPLLRYSSRNYYEPNTKDMEVNKKIFRLYALQITFDDLFFNTENRGHQIQSLKSKHKSNKSRVFWL